MTAAAATTAGHGGGGNGGGGGVHGGHHHHGGDWGGRGGHDGGHESRVLREIRPASMGSPAPPARRPLLHRALRRHSGESHLDRTEFQRECPWVVVVFGSDPVDTEPTDLDLAREAALNVPGVVDAYIQRALQRGMWGDDVTELQRRLNSTGANLETDGDFGPNTESAVRQYQYDHDLPVDGIGRRGWSSRSIRPTPRRPRPRCETPSTTRLTATTWTSSSRSKARCRTSSEVPFSRL